MKASSEPPVAYSATFPTWGMTQGGSLFQLPQSERPISAKGYSFLPTPVASDSKGNRNSTCNRSNPDSKHHDGTTLTDAVTLLPTPSSSDGIGGGPNNPHSRIEKGHQLQLIDLGITTDLWGKYAEAVRHWEALTRTAPPPTELNLKGTPRLRAVFSEWMMGWPAGWVTDVPDIARKHQLRIIGNGVVPQQAEAALSLLAL
jgi:DNA (cytosine-5)-methyltransferase 1